MTPLGLTLVLLVAAYLGAYYAAVMPVNGREPDMGFESRRTVIPVYRVQAKPYLAETGWQSFFGPAHWLDGRFRPKLWNSAGGRLLGSGAD